MAFRRGGIPLTARRAQCILLSEKVLWRTAAGRADTGGDDERKKLDHRRPFAGEASVRGPTLQSVRRTCRSVWPYRSVGVEDGDYVQGVPPRVRWREAEEPVA